MPQMGPLMWFAIFNAVFLILWIIISKQMFQTQAPSSSYHPTQSLTIPNKWMW